MKVEISRSYVNLGVFNLWNYSDKTFGRFIKELLADTEESADYEYKELRVKIVDGDSA